VPRRFVHPGPGQRVPIGDLIIVVEISKMVVCLEVCPRERNLAFHQIRVRLHFFLMSCLNGINPKRGTALV
jgi:hypothetical protein